MSDALELRKPLSVQTHEGEQSDYHHIFKNYNIFLKINCNNMLFQPYENHVKSIYLLKNSVEINDLKKHRNEVYKDCVIDFFEKLLQRTAILLQFPVCLLTFGPLLYEFLLFLIVLTLFSLLYFFAYFSNLIT